MEEMKTLSPTEISPSVSTPRLTPKKGALPYSFLSVSSREDLKVLRVLRGSPSLCFSPGNRVRSQCAQCTRPGQTPTCGWVYGGVVTSRAELHVPEDGGVSYLHMNPPAVLNKNVLMRIAAKKIMCGPQIWICD